MGTDETRKVSRRTLIEGIVKPRLNEIFSMIRLDLEKAGIANKIPSGAVITGGGALGVGTVDSAKKMLGLPVRIAKPTGVTGLVDDILEPQFAVAVGLIKYGAAHSYQQKETQFSTRIRLPGGGWISKITSSIRNLLP